MKQKTQYKHAFNNHKARIYRLKDGVVHYFSPFLSNWDYSTITPAEFLSGACGQLKPVTRDEARKIESKAFRNKK